MAATASHRHAASLLLVLLCLMSAAALAALGAVDAEQKPTPAGYNKKPAVKPPYVAPVTGGKAPPVYPVPGTGTYKPGGKAPPVYPAPGATKPGGKAPPVYPAPSGTNKPGPGSGSGGGGVGSAIPTIPGFTIPGMGGIPGLGGGWGGGVGGPAGGYARGGVVAPTVVCAEKGPCRGKRVTCPKKCFSSYSGAGKGYGGGGGGGSCNFDCKVKCTAYC